MSVVLLVVGVTVIICCSCVESCVCPMPSLFLHLSHREHKRKQKCLGSVCSQHDFSHCTLICEKIHGKCCMFSLSLLLWCTAWSPRETEFLKECVNEYARVQMNTLFKLAKSNTENFAAELTLDQPCISPCVAAMPSWCPSCGHSGYNCKQNCWENACFPRDSSHSTWPRGWTGGKGSKSDHQHFDLEWCICQNPLAW